MCCYFTDSKCVPHPCGSPGREHDRWEVWGLYSTYGYPPPSLDVRRTLVSLITTTAPPVLTVRRLAATGQTAGASTETAQQMRGKYASNIDTSMNMNFKGVNEIWLNTNMV